jgi:hypothetical protein
MSENPFEVLRLPPTATPEEVVRQGARLCQRTADESARDAVRQAVRELTESDESRELLALLTPRSPGYGGAELERLAASHRRPPAAQAAPEPMPLDAEEFRGLLLAAVAGEPPPVAPPLERVAAGEEPDEIERQTGEALWQSLPAQPRG